FCVLIALPGRAGAWGPDGHKTVAAIADKLIAGTNAANQVQAILAGTSLEDAAVWADCAAIPAEMTPANLNAAWFASAKQVPKTSGAVAKWPTAWATGSVKQA